MSEVDSRHIYAVIRLTNVYNVMYVSLFKELCDDVCADMIAETGEDHSVVRYRLPPGHLAL